MEALYIEEQKHQDRLVAERESRLMVKEDRRSQFAEEYWKECTLFDKTAAAASRRAATLQHNRDSDEAKRLEVGAFAIEAVAVPAQLVSKMQMAHRKLNNNIVCVLYC